MAYSVEVRLNRTEISAFLYTRAGPMVRNVAALGQRVQRVAMRRVDSDTGTVASSIRVVVGSQPGFIFADIGSPLPQALWHHEGTGVYGPRGRPIRPRSARVLRFKAGKTPRPRTSGYRAARPDNRGWQFSPSVRGQRPNPFLVSALNDVMGSAARIRSMRRVR